MNVFDHLTSLFAPHDCLSCGAEGYIICEDCIHGWSNIPDRCFRCHKLTDNARTCTNCRRVTNLSHVQAATLYTGTAKDLVWQLKFHGTQAAATVMAECLAPLINRDTDSAAILVNIPTATNRVRQRGYDQARLLARAVASQTGRQQSSLLSRLGQHHQVGASRQQRLTQLAQAFRVTKPSAVAGRHIILVDDVLTTGATLTAAARTLKLDGAARVDAVVFAQA